MTKRPVQSTAMSFQYATQRNLLMIALAVLSISLALVLAHHRAAHAQTMVHLRSTWFDSFTGSQGPIGSALLPPADRLSVPHTTRTAHL